MSNPNDTFTVKMVFKGNHIYSLMVNNIRKLVLNADRRYYPGMSSEEKELFNFIKNQKWDAEFILTLRDLHILKNMKDRELKVLWKKSGN